MASVHSPKFGARDILKYIGPGFLVTVGFIDPGNWASNIAAGSDFGYRLLWMVTLSTIMLIILQHNAAHLGIATGLCLAEAASKHFPRPASWTFLITAVAASIFTSLAEILGAAIGLNMLLGLPLKIGAMLAAAVSLAMVLTNGYKRIEIWIIGFVSLIGLSFLFELSLVDIPWNEAVHGWFVPSFPAGSAPVIMSVLGAVVMPHNIFLHSEIIQSRQWNLEDDETINRQLKFEFIDTLSAMLVGWAINSAMILVAASVFHAGGVAVSELSQAQETMRPLLGDAASTVFAFALLLAGFSSSVTSAMAGGSIYAGIFHEPYDPADSHSRAGAALTILGALAIIMFITNPFKGIIWSQIMLSIQLPITVFGLIALTSSEKVMGRFVTPGSHKVMLWTTAIIVTALNVMLLMSFVS